MFVLSLTKWPTRKKIKIPNNQSTNRYIKLPDEIFFFIILLFLGAKLFLSYFAIKSKTKAFYVTMILQFKRKKNWKKISVEESSQTKKIGIYKVLRWISLFPWNQLECLETSQTGGSWNKPNLIVLKQIKLERSWNKSNLRVLKQVKL